MAAMGMMPVVRMHQRGTLWVLCCATIARASEGYMPVFKLKTAVHGACAQP